MAQPPITRARGANVLVSGAFETAAAGTVPAGGFFGLPIVSVTLSEERTQNDSDLIGLGREPQDPTPDVANDTGDIVVPVDVRNFGRWLRLLFGAPVSTGTPAKATGAFAFSAQPADATTITINGTVFTFTVAASSDPYHIQIKSSLDTTLQAAVNAINASSQASFVDASRVSGSGTLTLTADNGGPAGNSITLSASSGSNATRSGSTMTGGALATHVFTSGAAALPSMSFEIGHPEIPAFFMHYGLRGGSLRLTMQRSGNFSATISVVAQGEQAATGATQANSNTPLPVMRFASASGAITRDGLALGNVLSADLMISNNLEPIETIQPDGRIADADPGMSMATLNIKMLFADLTMLNLATNGTPVGIVLTWTAGAYSLSIAISRLFIPKPKRTISGPKGIPIDFAGDASGAQGASTTVTLANDVAAYA